ncbi:MAG: hypothetical protein ACI9G1_002191 [Pirellulaceae bacterium]|jgi:hypothetical protein
MSPLFETVDSLTGEHEDVIRRRRYGVIEIRSGEFVGIHFRPWPKIISVAEAWWDGGVRSGNNRDRCLLYVNQPIVSPAYLALKYIVSSQATSLKTIRKSLQILDHVARIKQTDAIVCEASNMRISDRLLKRWGWEPHVESSNRRHHIRRFYGEYPNSAPTLSLQH